MDQDRCTGMGRGHTGKNYPRSMYNEPSQSTALPHCNAFQINGLAAAHAVSSQGNRGFPSLDAKQVRDWIEPDSASESNLELCLIQRESLSKVHPANLRVISQLVRGSGAKDFPFGDDVGPVGYRERFAHIVIRDKNADSAG